MEGVCSPATDWKVGYGRSIHERGIYTQVPEYADQYANEEQRYFPVVPSNPDLEFAGEV